MSTTYKRVIFKQKKIRILSNEMASFPLLPRRQRNILWETHLLQDTSTDQKSSESRIVRSREDEGAFSSRAANLARGAPYESPPRAVTSGWKRNLFAQQTALRGPEVGVRSRHREKLRANESMRRGAQAGGRAGERRGERGHVRPRMRRIGARRVVEGTSHDRRENRSFLGPRST